MATAIRTIGHDERLSIVDHLEELRTRLIVSAVAFGVVFAVCLWQNHALLGFINRPLHKQTRAAGLERSRAGRADLVYPEGGTRRGQGHPGDSAGSRRTEQWAAGRHKGAAGGLDCQAAGRYRQAATESHWHQSHDAGTGRTAHRDIDGDAVFLARPGVAPDPVRAIRLRPACIEPASSDERFYRS